MKLETVAIRLRNALLERMSENELHQIDRIRLQLVKSTKHPEKLPVSSLFAYRFLKALNPIQDRFIDKKLTGTLRFSWQKAYQLFLDKSLDHCEQIKNIPEYLSQFDQFIPDDIEQLLQKYNISAGNYSALRSLQWFRQEKNFMPFIISCKLLKDFEKRGKLFRWSNRKYLWRTRHQSNKIITEINHAFGNLPSTLLLNILDKIGDKSKLNPYLVQYYEDPRHRAFQNYIQNNQTKKNSLGIFQDIVPIADAVQNTYFKEYQEKIKVEWLNHYATRKLAHYNFKEDTIGLSLIFDLPKIDKNILKFIIYHEMLHKHLGLKVAKKRMQAHTPEFRKMERIFPQFQELDAKLSNYAQGKIE